MISFVNNYSYNKIRIRNVGGLITGIWKHPNIMITPNTFPLPSFYDFSASYADFEKFVEDSPRPMSYHLCGYGTLLNESILGFIGESAERYTFASLFKDELKRKNIPIICNLDYLRIFDENNINNLQFDEQIRWIKMNSLNNIGTKVAVPFQLFVSASDTMLGKEKRFLHSAVSTGTACQESFLKALEAAIIEIEQIDSFNLWWYGGLEGKKIEVNISKLLGEIFKNKRNSSYFLDNFKVCFTDISFDKNLDVVVCEIFAKDNDMCLPKYTVGVQGAKNMKKAIYRGFLEALTVLSFNLSYPWIYPEKYKAVKENEIMNNLDKNIVWYSKYGKPQKVKHNKKYNFNIGAKTYDLIKDICSFGNTTFMDITLPEFAELNLFVVRVINPHLLTICLPSYPPKNHPRYKKIGGILNYVPHPLA